MFTDGNYLNRAEAAAMIPGLQIEDATFIPRLLDGPRFAGKNNECLSRLMQYKVLESKRAARRGTTGGNEAFLRASSIRIFIDHDIAPNVDRAIELINRTKQPNFTRNRLPEDTAAARAELLTSGTACGGRGADRPVETVTVDWITQVFSGDAQAPRAAPIAPSMVLFGGCEMLSIAAYLKPYTIELTVFGNYAVNGMFNWVNCSKPIIWPVRSICESPI